MRRSRPSASAGPSCRDSSSYADGEMGPAFGAARLARLALDPGDAGSVLAEPRLADLIVHETSLADAYRPRVEAFRRLYAALHEGFRDNPARTA